VRITANQVTLVRLVLLPLPVAMIYQGSRAWMLGALFIFILLGLTDALDGYLARKYGSTPLGALLDPIADKIFLVAGFVPLADHQIIPTTFVVVLFVRELGVTFLRSVALEEGFQFKTSKAAKLKTTVQMAGSGLTLLVALYPEGPTIHVIFGVMFALSLVPAIVAIARGKAPGWMAWSAAALFGANLLVRALVSGEVAIVAIMIVIVAITLYSGAEYAWGMRSVLAARFRRSPVEALRLAGLSLAVPAFYLPSLDRPDDPTVPILLLLAAEFASGGLDNSLAQYGHGRTAAPDLVRSGIQAATGAFVLTSLLTLRHPVAARVATVFALAVTLGDLGARFWRHRRDFAGSLRPSAPAGRPSLT
jgi:CDP-diacylglycerol--glycerol-3-phosphate 3-phosphatidyltransferase